MPPVTTRRQFLASGTLAGAALTARPFAALAGWQRGAPRAVSAAYAGYVSVRRDNRVSVFTMDAATGKVTWQEPVPVEGGPDPMALDPRGRFLYVACRDRQQASSFRIDPVSGRLSLIGTIPLQGEPIQIITDRTGRYLLSVFFYQSTVGVHAIGNDGRLAFPPIEWRYTAYGAHGIEISRSNRHVFVPHVARSGGPNAVAQLHFDPSTGRLRPNTPPFLSLHENEGPRHLVVHPTLDAAYSADEQGCTATAYRLDPVQGTLSKLHSISTVPSDYMVKGQITGSEVLVHPNGRLLLVSTREHDSISSFEIDHTTGRLTHIDRVPTEPAARALCIDPAGRFMAAAGSGGNAGRMATYEIDAGTGRMTPREIYDAGNGPMWILMTPVRSREAQ